MGARRARRRDAEAPRPPRGGRGASCSPIPSTALSGPAASG